LPIIIAEGVIAANNTYLLCEQGKGKVAIVTAQEATTNLLLMLQLRKLQERTGLE
jgi:hypothetical protein